MKYIVEKIQTVTILIGPVCCGKSTYRQQNHFDFVVSSDDIVEKLCQENSLVYSDFFALNHRHSIKQQHREQFQQAIKHSTHQQNIVWDLTNLTQAERRNIMKHYPKAKFQAVEFCFIGYEKEIIHLSQLRGEKSGEKIPEPVIQNMLNRYQAVKPYEGFIEVVKVDMFAQLKHTKQKAIKI
jgi:tRNA uridine 5-carbamoylmethylation protein Kti12